MQMAAATFSLNVCPLLTLLMQPLASTISAPIRNPDSMLEVALIMPMQ